MTTDAQYLYSLSENVQRQVVDVVRRVAGLSREEKVKALIALNGAADALFLELTAESLEAIQPFAALAELIAGIDQDAHPRTDSKEAA